MNNNTIVDQKSYKIKLKKQKPSSFSKIEIGILNRQLYNLLIFKYVIGKN